MKWQEYQKIVGQLFEQAEGIGSVHRNIYRPDKVTGQPRQIDAWLEVETKGMKLGVLIDAKYHKEKIDVKDVEDVLALANAVGAVKSVIVCSNGWTGPAEKKAIFSGMSLKLLTLEGAIDIIEPNKWKLCPDCQNDFIILDQEGMIEYQGLISWWLAGQCRECKTARVFCQGCGIKVIIPINETFVCTCGHEWGAKEDGIYLTFEKDSSDEKTFIDLNQMTLKFEGEKNK
jgi:Restriction endonuclease